MKIQGPYGNDVPPAKRSGKTDAAARKDAVTRPEAAAEAAKPVEPAAPADAVQISAAALEIQRLLETAKSSPDVRATLVERIRQLVQTGRYQVDNRSLALRLIDEYLSR
jgi:flagellar biosynthesis anti-sigma factor FlgM